MYIICTNPNQSGYLANDGGITTDLDAATLTAVNTLLQL